LDCRADDAGGYSSGIVGAATCRPPERGSGGYSHDNLFYSLTGLPEIQTTAYDKERNATFFGIAA
jgi:hypothetical protein